MNTWQQGFQRTAGDCRRSVFGHRAGQKAEAIPGVHYRLLAQEANEQFAELVEVMGLQGVVPFASRCGICNGDDWHTLRPEQVRPGEVPAAVISMQPVLP